MSRCPECGIDPLECECAVSESSCIDIEGSGFTGVPLKFLPKIDPDPENLLACGEDGLELDTSGLANRPAVHIFNASDIVLPTAEIVYPFPFNSVRYDTDGMADLSGNAIVIQTPGVYTVTSLFQFTVGEGFQDAVLNLNGVAASFARTPSGSSATSKHTMISLMRELEAGDVLDMVVFAQDSGVEVVARTYSPNFAAVWERGPIQ